MDNGLHWMRQRQQRITRLVLAFFCLVWLQVAAIPCVAAHVTVRAAGADQAGHAGHGSPAAHDGHEQLQREAGVQADRHCMYCPPADGAQSAQSDAGGACAFPHEAQVDARSAALAIPPLVCGGSVRIGSDATSSVAIRVADPPVPPPRRSLAVDYCRFIE